VVGRNAAQAARHGIGAERPDRGNARERFTSLRAARIISWAGSSPTRAL
jgi:hypothetical protein